MGSEQAPTGSGSLAEAIREPWPGWMAAVPALWPVELGLALSSLFVPVGVHLMYMVCIECTWARPRSSSVTVGHRHRWVSRLLAERH